MNRLIPLVTALFLAPAALAQEAAAPVQAAPAEEGPDVAALEGKLEALAEQVAELKTGVDGLKKLKLSGYVQGRWAWQESARYNASTDAGPSQTNLFIRRARFKAAYDADWSQYFVQLDATPRYVLVKEAYATLKLPEGLALDAGLQLIPFGYEVLVRSSSDLDLLERAAVTRHFVDGEYDLGVSLRGVRGPLSFRVGLFNGNGVAAWSTGSGSAGLDNDQKKDVIGRVGYDLGFVTGGFSGWYGKTIDYNGATNEEHDRYRFGADVQVFLDLLPFGGTAVKGEYLRGKTGLGSGNGGAGNDLGKEGAGWYALVTQNLGPYHQLAARYEQFEKDLDLEGADPEDAVQVALHTFIGEGYKLSAAWFHPLNDAAGEDPKADQLIVQAQARF